MRDIDGNNAVMPQEPHELRWTALHITAEELTGGEPVTLDDVIEHLAKISVYDVLRVICVLDVHLVAKGGRLAKENQQQLIDLIAAGQDALKRGLTQANDQGRVIFFGQQLYHLARLAILHADDRRGDDFADGTVVADFLIALVGVTDLFETDFGAGDQWDAIRSWELRASAMNRVESRIFQWSFYFELFEVIWPKVKEAPDADDAFQRYTGLTINEFLALGFASSAGFTDESTGQLVGRFHAASWFANVPESSWRSYLAETAGSVSDLRAAILKEEQEVGESQSLSLAIEKRPLVLDEAGNVYSVSFAAFERKATHGIFHILSERAEDEGLNRETFTRPFGAAFQRWTEDAFTRMEGGQDEPTIIADEEYGKKGQRVSSPDVVLAYERQMVVSEVVAGAMHIRSLTHGNLKEFNKDLEKFVFKKARQLNDRIRDIVSGDARSVGLDPAGISNYRPVIITSAPLPLRAEISKRIRNDLKAKHLLTAKNISVLSIVEAEEVAGLEAYIESADESVLDVLVAWKSHRKTGDLPLKNFLWERGGPRPPSAHVKAMFGAASKDLLAFFFSNDLPATSA